MCGIIGYDGWRNDKVSIALGMLKKLEYRGYDSAGLAYISADGKLDVIKRKGKIKDLESTINIRGDIIRIIGHTRWATHGQPNDINSHPHVDCNGHIAVVHNGIIENFQELKDELISNGHRFVSDTDTEVIAHLIEQYARDMDMFSAFQRAISRIEGAYALAVISPEFDGILIARKDSPLVIGLGKKETFLASDITPLIEYTRKVIFLHDGDYGYIRGNEVKIYNGDTEVKRKIDRINYSPEMAEKGGYEHYMLKEIYEQPEALRASILGRTTPPYLSLNSTTERWEEFDRIDIVACGTSYHAGLVGKYYLERLLSIPVMVHYASEYRYYPRIAGNPLVIAITQSGETADTLAAVKEARHLGLSTLALTNVMGSTVTRIAEEVVYTQAGPEIGVAATKTFTTQIIGLLLIALAIGSETNRIPTKVEKDIIEALEHLPRHIEMILGNTAMIETTGEMVADYSDVFFIGRNIMYPVALEGALKLKEISYIHAEGYPAGELKHGPLALITPETPVIALLDPNILREKMLSNIEEVISRGSPVIILGDEKDEDLDMYSDMVIRIPSMPEWTRPIGFSVPLQLLAYHAARKRGCEIDQPRNLAKSVTVE